MANRKSDTERKEAKRVAVVGQLKGLHTQLDTLSGMWDEHKLDAMILALGIGKVELFYEQE